MTYHTNHLFDGTRIGLEDMLAAREHRVHLRQETLKRHGLPTVTLTLVMPGPIKDCALSRQVADVALAQISGSFQNRQWSFECTMSDTLPTGPEALFAVAADPHALKRQMVALEEDHPLGRLWDLDVHTAQAESLSRRTLGLAPRRCLVCDSPAHACTRSQAHSLDMLRGAMECRLLAWREAARVASADDRGTP